MSMPLFLLRGRNASGENPAQVQRPVARPEVERSAGDSNGHVPVQSLGRNHRKRDTNRRQQRLKKLADERGFFRLNDRPYLLL
jgi:hypothetical protein